MERKFSAKDFFVEIILFFLVRPLQLVFVVHSRSLNIIYLTSMAFAAALNLLEGKPVYERPLVYIVFVYILGLVLEIIASYINIKYNGKIRPGGHRSTEKIIKTYMYVTTFFSGFLIINIILLIAYLFS